MTGPASPARPRARRPLRQWLLIGGNAAVATLFALVAVVLAYSYEQYDEIPRIALGDFLASDQDPGATGPARNFLVVGADSAHGLDPGDPLASSRAGVGGTRSDTMMVLRVDPNRARAALLSLPRDLHVPFASGGSDRLNAAIQYGGPDLLIDTIEAFLGIPIHHYVQIDFFAFVELVDIVGGVPVSFPHPARDRRSGLAVDAGCQLLDGRTALAHVRSRAFQERIDGRWRTDGSGDLGRIRRQQSFVLAALERALHRGVRNPVTLDRLVDRAMDVVVVDDTLTAEDLVSAAVRFSAFDPGSLELFQLPVHDATVGGAAVLRLDEVAAGPVLDVFRTPDGTGPTESAVRVRVLNGTGRPGEAAAAAAALSRIGFASGGTGDADRLGVTRSELRHPPGLRWAAQLVDAWTVVDLRLIQDRSVSGPTLVTGTDWDGLRDERGEIAVGDDAGPGRPPGPEPGVDPATSSTSPVPVPVASC